MKNAIKYILLTCLTTIIVVAGDLDDPNAQYEIGLQFFKEKNYGEAKRWFLLAAEQSHSDAQYRIGKMHHYGEGVEKDFNKALHYFLARYLGHKIPIKDLGQKIEEIWRQQKNLVNEYVGN